MQTTRTDGAGVFDRACNTFIDDLFAFIITMPGLHRMSVFRDDIVFFIYLYQRWIYRKKPKRGADGTGKEGAEHRREGASDGQGGAQEGGSGAACETSKGKTSKSPAGKAKGH